MPDTLIDTPAWQALARHHEDVRGLHLRDLFAGDPARAERMSLEAAGIHADLSKHRATGKTVELLLALAGERGVASRRDAMFRGEHVNVTEDRAALHVALRMPRDRSLVVDGRDVVRDVHDVLDRMATFAERVRSGEWRGHSGERIRAVVNIGIGGSDLGPAMAYQALRAYSDRGLAFRFVSNVDASDVAEALRDLDPATTLAIVSSKTFTTVETMTNARTVRQWLLDGLGGDETAIAKHVVAVSTNLDAVAEFGIDPTNAFGFWDWVGGRYSMDSAIGLSTMIAIGPESFHELLAGFHAVDRHFAEAPPERNLPLLMGMLGIWYRDFFGTETHAVLPYEQYLARFPAYLQQLVMESNGKRVTLAGEPVVVDTSPIVWGEPGTNGQHSFHQLLHQGTALVPVDFVAFATSLNPLGDHHALLLANALAQAQALAFGRTAEELRDAGVREVLVPHKEMPGNRPSTFLLLQRLTPFALGSLVALYEHVVFTQGVVWDIDSFDQWGVELGKELAQRLAPAVAGERTDPHLDSSTAALLARIHELRSS
jgi:glucose-6-phosphate isomerase